jgi:transposase
MSTGSIAPYFDFARVKVVGQSIHRGLSTAMVHVEPDLRYRPLCHECRIPARTVHSAGHRRLVRDLSMTDRQIWLQVEYRKVYCPHCGKARVEHLSFCQAKQRLTHRLARYVYELCIHMAVTEVAEHLDLNPKTVKSIDKVFLEKEFGCTDTDGLRLLAIDEIAVKKGHTYMTVILDYLTGRVVWMGQGRSKETLDAFFEGMTAPQKQAIDAVAMDMWDPYINRVRHHCPQAKIVFDLFHLVKGYSRVIDEVRREELRNADPKDHAVIKGSRYLLLKNHQNLGPEQCDRLDKLLEANANLNATYALKDQLKMIYRYSRPAAAKEALDQWCAMAAKIINPWMQKFVRMLRRREEGILNHCHFAIGTSVLEGVNNTIKVIKRKAYGFQDQDYFALKVKQAFPGRHSTNFLG